MKAVVLCGRGKVEYREVEKPQIGERDLLIEVKACGICGSDLHFFYGGMEPIGEVPLVMGHEFAGIIVEKGKEVEDYWQIGDIIEVGQKAAEDIVSEHIEIFGTKPLTK